MVKMNDIWTTFDKALEVNVCVIVKRRLGKGKRYEYQEVCMFRGDWNDLVHELYITYNQFVDQVEHLSKKQAIYERLDMIASELERRNSSYEFVLPDFTDEWFVAYCKPAVFRIDGEGNLG